MQYQHGTLQNKDELSFVMSAVSYISSFVIKQNSDWNRIYFAYAKRLGCSMGKFEEERDGEPYHVRIMHCMNDALLSDVPDNIVFE